MSRTESNPFAKLNRAVIQTICCFDNIFTCAKIKKQQHELHSPEVWIWDFGECQTDLEVPQSPESDRGLLLWQSQAKVGYPQVCMYVCIEVALRGDAHEIGRSNWGKGRDPSGS